MNGVSGEGRNVHVWNTLWTYQLACKIHLLYGNNG